MDLKEGLERGGFVLQKICIYHSNLERNRNLVKMVDAQRYGKIDGFCFDEIGPRDYMGRRNVRAYGVYIRPKED
jgi:hypothetical protein